MKTNKPKPKILLIFMGGTIAMVKDPKTNALKPAKAPQELLSIEPNLENNFDISIEFIDNIDSTNIQPFHWTKIANTISKNYRKYEGFVVTHGTDTMAYSASAVSFALQDLDKPVVFTGAQLPPDHIASDARTNLVNAFRIASMNIPGVLIVFGTRILQGNRTTKISETDFDAFDSPVFQHIGKIRTEIDLYSVPKSAKISDIRTLSKFNNKVFLITLVPGIESEYLENLLDTDIKGFVISAYGPGNIPNKYRDLTEFVKLANKKRVPVVVTSQCIGGTSKMLLYEVGQDALNAGAISALDMTYEAATTKLMWILAQTNKIDKIKELFHKNFAGEFTENLLNQ